MAFRKRIGISRTGLLVSCSIRSKMGRVIYDGWQLTKIVDDRKDLVKQTSKVLF